ncbi:hypothetical protein GCM10027600_42950 [Nocardioides ginsengisegetis]
MRLPCRPRPGSADEPATGPDTHRARLTAPHGHQRFRVAWPGATADDWIDYADEERAVAMADVLVKTKGAVVVYAVNIIEDQEAA